jgi:hypothetical protein
LAGPYVVVAVAVRQPCATWRCGGGHEMAVARHMAVVATRPRHSSTDRPWTMWRASTRRRASQVVRGQVAWTSSRGRIGSSVARGVAHGSDRNCQVLTAVLTSFCHRRSGHCSGSGPAPGAGSWWRFCQIAGAVAAVVVVRSGLLRLATRLGQRLPPRLARSANEYPSEPHGPGERPSELR